MLGVELALFGDKVGEVKANIDERAGLIRERLNDEGNVRFDPGDTEFAVRDAWKGWVPLSLCVTREPVLKWTFDLEDTVEELYEV
jgi:hypothetical protein